MSSQPTKWSQIFIRHEFIEDPCFLRSKHSFNANNAISLWLTYSSCSNLSPALYMYTYMRLLRWVLRIYLGLHAQGMHSGYVAYTQLIPHARSLRILLIVTCSFPNIFNSHHCLNCVLCMIVVNLQTFISWEKLCEYII